MPSTYPRGTWPAVLLATFASAWSCRGGSGTPDATPVPAASATPTGAVWFDDVSPTSGIRVRNVCGGSSKEYILEVNGAGACWLDFDRDGMLDVYVVNGSTMERLRAGEPGEPNRLYRGSGDGRFVEIEGAAGAAHRGWGFGCVAADYDADGWTDLYVTNFGASVLYRNRGDGRFEDVTRAAGVDNPPPAGSAFPSWGTGAAFADIDGDGHLDLYVANYLDFNLADPPVDGKIVNGLSLSCKWGGRRVMCGPRGLPAQRHRLYRSRGDGTFADSTVESGIAAARPAYGFAVVPFDYDDDGDMDFYVANDSVENYLWDNDGGGRFEELALQAGAALNESGQAQASMGLDAQDYDGDGRLDLFFTNFAKDYNTLLRNLGGKQFMDVSFVSGVAAPSLERLGWGAGFFDVENDGDLDLYVVNGQVYSGADADGGEGTFRQRNQLYLLDSGRYEDVSDRGGSVFQARRVGRGAAFADFDADGGVDILVTNLDEEPTLLRNRAARGHWLEVELVASSANRDALGARVRARMPSGVTVSRDLHTGASYLSGNAARIHLGLGREAGVAELQVRWPNGKETTLAAVPIDRVVTIHEDSGLQDGPVRSTP